MLLAVATLPTSGAVRRYCAHIVRKVSDSSAVFIGIRLSFLNVMLLLNTAMLVSAAFEAHRRGQEYADAKAMHSVNRNDLLGPKWRAERNFWMAAFGTVIVLCVVPWTRRRAPLTLPRAHSMLQRMRSIHTHLDELEAGAEARASTARTATASTQEPAAPPPAQAATSVGGERGASPTAGARRRRRREE